MSIFKGKTAADILDQVYPDQRPGSGYCNELDERAIRNEQRNQQKPKLTRAERLRIDPDAWENMAEAWEDGEPEQFTCANCGRTGDQAEIIEATRRCGTGYGEWYCAPGFGCESHR